MTETSQPLPDATYILPLRWNEDGELAHLVSYLERLSSWTAVMVVDGSPDPLFQSHSQAFPAAVCHIRPEQQAGANGKVAGVLTGLAQATTELLVLADDDVRYERESLRRLLTLLDDADVVRPQNFFLSLPWHARWDTARTLLNRALSADFPGTLGVRRSALMATGGYDSNVLFENLELLRTIKAAGGRERRANDLFVGRVPPTSQHFWHQRVRQAYDDFAQPIRLCAELSLMPLFSAAAYYAVRHRRPRAALTLIVTVCAMAEIGRRRNGGRHIFPPTAALWAPLWIAERSMCIWVATAFRATGGIFYAGERLHVAAHTMRELRKRHANKIRVSETEKNHHS